MLLSLGFLTVHLLECLLVESLIRLMLAGVVVVLVLVLARVVLVRGVVVLLGAVDDEVIGISIVVAAHILITTPMAIQAVVVEP